KTELLFRMQSGYLVADREQKGEILDGFVAATGYHRKYAASVLASTLAGLPANGNRIRTRKYDTEVKLALISGSRVALFEARSNHFDEAKS
ncbi:hypothetical protein ABTC05_18935, partial [Acinetobacter baumannii]